MRLILDSGDLDCVRQSLDSPEPDQAADTIVVLGVTGHPASVGLIESILDNKGRPTRLRRQAIRSLARSRVGAEILLKHATEQSVPDGLLATVRSALRQAAWPDVRGQYQQLFPSPPTRDGLPLPAISELITRAGDAARGAELFQRPEVACSQCHRVRDEGIDFGPDLSGIGTKLSPEAIFESILDPSAGVSFGFEGWEIELEDGSEWFGMIVSETAETVTMKTQGGITTRFPKSSMVRRTQQATSIMPTGLQQAMTAQELVDLVSYLESLRSEAATVHHEQSPSNTAP